MNVLCIICHDFLNQAENIYVTKCGHMFHYQCLTQWIESSSSCPQCRNNVTDTDMFRVFLTISDDGSEDVTVLQSRLDDAVVQLHELRAALRQKDNVAADLTIKLNENKELLKAKVKKLVSHHSAMSALRDQLECARAQARETQRLQEENDSLKKSLLTLNGCQMFEPAEQKCIEPHLTAECPNAQGGPVCCYNCGGPHAASYRKCPQRQVYLAALRKRPSQHTPARPHQFVSNVVNGQDWASVTGTAPQHSGPQPQAFRPQLPPTLGRQNRAYRVPRFNLNQSITGLEPAGPQPDYLGASSSSNVPGPTVVPEADMVSLEETIHLIYVVGQMRSSLRRSMRREEQVMVVLEFLSYLEG